MVRLLEDDFPPRMYTFAHVFLIRGYVDSVTEGDINFRLQ